MRLNLYPRWGIELDTPYDVNEHERQFMCSSTHPQGGSPEQPDRKVEYADRDELMDAILERYPPTEATLPAQAAPAEGKKKVRV